MQPRFVTIQFLLAKQAQVPLSVQGQKIFPAESSRKKRDRQERKSGERTVEPTENVSVSGFVTDLTGDYELVDVACQERPRPKGKGNKPYHMVRFVFVHRDHAHPSPKFRQVREQLMSALHQLAREAMWRVLAYKNPLYVDGEEVVGERTFSVDCKARTPYVGGDGKRVVQWERDAVGEKIGDAPIPVTADYELRLVGGDLALID